MLTDTLETPSFLNTPKLSLLTPKDVLMMQVMERIAKRASAQHEKIAYAFTRPVSWDGMLFSIQKTSGLGQNINFNLSQGSDQVADFDIRNILASYRWNLWHRIVGEETDDTRFRHQGHGSRILHAIEAYLFSIWEQDQRQGPPHEICCTTNQDDVKGLLIAHQYEKEGETGELYQKTIHQPRL